MASFANDHGMVVGPESISASRHNVYSISIRNKNVIGSCLLLTSSLSQLCNVDYY